MDPDESESVVMLYRTCMSRKQAGAMWLAGWLFTRVPVPFRSTLCVIAPNSTGFVAPRLATRCGLTGFGDLYLSSGRGMYPRVGY